MLAWKVHSIISRFSQPRFVGLYCSQFPLSSAHRELRRGMTSGPERLRYLRGSDDEDELLERASKRVRIGPSIDTILSTAKRPAKDGEPLPKEPGPAIDTPDLDPGLAVQHEGEGDGKEFEQKAKDAKGKMKGKEKKQGRRRRLIRNDEVPGTPLDKPKAPRLPKRQCAMLIGYCGSGYSGMQIQPDHTKTIEGVFFNALSRAGAISQNNADDPTKVGLARAARTDAGVHAAGNLVSLKLIADVPGVENLVARVNEELPPEIRLWGFVRTQNSFNARLVCDSRKYTYFFPSYLLIPPKPGSGMDRVMTSRIVGSSTELRLDSFWEGQESNTHESDLLRKRSWRVSQEKVLRLREIARNFEGTHNFHNFTVSLDFADKSNNRHMKRIEIADPVVYGDTEWISVLFHGQSFMLHQIVGLSSKFVIMAAACISQRKMMSSLVLSCRTNTPANIIDELYGHQNVFIPKMPSLGLLLEEPLFHSYNTRMEVINKDFQPTDAEYRPSIDFDVHREKIVAFKETFIYKNMREVEDRDGLFDAWIRALDAYAGNDLLYLNPSAIIPPEAVIKKGERRDQPFREKRIFDATSFPAGLKRVIQEDIEDSDFEVDKLLAETEG